MNAASISTSITATSARLGVMLTDLRLPTIKRLAGDLCAQSDSEGWPGTPLAGSAAGARNQRARVTPH
jgi:hypothetical protein